jgi:acyl carrier protein
MSDLHKVQFSTFAIMVAETFNLLPSAVTRDTRCEDVPGWDSLGHSVLLSRLERRLHIGLTEADAALADTAGELYDRIAALSPSAAP